MVAARGTSLQPRRNQISGAWRLRLALHTPDERLRRKKAANHAAAGALYVMWYSFGRIHQTLRVTPAMEAGVSDHVWSVREIVGFLA